MGIFKWKNKGNDVATAAECALDKTLKRVNRLGEKFASLDSDDIKADKNVWKILPDSIAKGVKVMKLNSGLKYKSFFCHMFPNAQVLPHKHPKEYVAIKVMEGTIEDKITCKVYKKGDVVEFDKNEIHHLCALEKEAYLHIVFAENKRKTDVVNEDVDFNILRKVS